MFKNLVNRYLKPKTCVLCDKKMTKFYRVSESGMLTIWFCPSCEPDPRNQKQVQ